MLQTPLSQSLAPQPNRRNSMDRAQQKIAQQQDLHRKQAFFNAWILERSHYAYTPAQQDLLSHFNHSLQAMITELWIGIKAVAGQLVQANRPVGLVEQLVQIGLSRIPFVGTQLVAVEQTVMMERYTNGIKRLSEKLSTFTSMDSVNKTLSARITAYYRSEILNPSDELRQLEAFFQPLMDFKASSL